MEAQPSQKSAHASTDPWLAPIEDVVAEGVLIALSAVRMATKNYILRSAIRDQLDYDQVRYETFARSTLRQLADENIATADRLSRQTTPNAATLRITAQKEHAAARKRGPEVHRRLSAALIKSITNDSEVAALVQEARSHALDEVEHEIRRRLIDCVVVPDALYDLERERRMLRLVGHDLRVLRKRRLRGTRR